MKSDIIKHKIKFAKNSEIHEKEDVCVKKRSKCKTGICGAALAASLAFGGCGAYAVENPGAGLDTPEEAVECVMESLKTLDMKEFNSYTDNYVRTYYNWMGVPVRKEYRVFNELQQPVIKTGKWKKRYEYSYKLSQKMMENLEWKIEEVEEEREQAKINMEITNLNMTDVMGKYELQILENMIESPGTGLGQLLKDLSEITGEKGGLLSLIEECDQEDLCTLNVTVTADRENGGWKIHLDEELINALMGNIGAEEYSEDIQQRILELEKQQSEKLDEWEDAFEEQMEEQMEKWDEKVAGGGYF